MAPGALGFKDKARTKPLQPSTLSALCPPFPVLHGHLAHSKAVLEAAVHLILSKALPGSSDGHQWKASLRTNALLWASPPSSPSALTPRPRASYESCISSPGCCSQRRQLLPKRVGTARAGGKGSGTPAGSGDRKLEEADPERGRWMLATCSVQGPAASSRGHQALAAAPCIHPSACVRLYPERWFVPP